MVKEKKGKKGHKEEDIGNDNQKNTTGSDMSKSKKQDRKKKAEWEDDVANEIASMALQEKNEDSTEKSDEPIVKTKEKKKTRKNEGNKANEKISASKSTMEKYDSQDDEYEKNNRGDSKDFETKSKSSLKYNKKKDIKLVQELGSEDENEKIASTKKPNIKEDKKGVKFAPIKSVFELLVDEGTDDDENESDFEGRSNKYEEEIIENDLPEQTKEQKKEKEEKGGKKNKKDQKKKQEEEEIERMLAEIELGRSKKVKSKQKEEIHNLEEKEVESGGAKKNKPKQREEVQETEEKGLTIVTEIPEEEEEKLKKRKKKKGQEEEKPVEKDKEDMKEKDEIEEFSLKSTAQKKKEKKEREKQKKLAQKTQQKKTKEEVKATENENETSVNIQTEPSKQEEPLDKLDTEEKAEEDEDDDGKKSKKDKKKKKVDKDKDDKDKKRPGKKQILAMQEALKKIKEEEEKRRLEEEEKQRAAEEAERLRQEKIRLALERKEKRKQKEKEKRERLKAEGKLLTQSQKQQRARAQAMLESLRAQGIDVPKIGEKKERLPRLGDRVRTKKPKQDNGEGQENDESKESTPETDSVQDVVDSAGDKIHVVEKTESKEVIPGENEESIKDAWDESSSNEEEEEDEEKQTSETVINSKVIIEVEPKKDDETEEEEESKMSESESEEETQSESESESDSEDEQKTTSETIRERAMNRINKRRENNEKNRNMDKLRSPVVCVLGHVDTGKTKILDKIRHTHVQDSEAGGITQQIGATMVPVDAIGEQCKMVKNFSIQDIKIPGLLIIDTPGHESFSNLRSRGSSLCDIAILVVDIMHGLEPQTIESINLLKQKKTPFVVALNKIDRLYEWKQNRNKDVQDTLKSQNRNTHLEFEERCKSVILQFAEQGLNATLFYENKDPRTFISLVPTSAMSGDGMGNLIALVVELTQTMMAKRLAFFEELQATVLEVKAVPGLGTTIDVILVNGRMKEGDTLILAGIEGPLVTQIRSLLMPQPLKELRVKNPYQEYKEVEGAQGVKVTGKDLDKAIAGLNVLIAHYPDEVEILKEEVAKELQAVMNSIKLAERGVYVQASTLGSLEALLEFLATSKIPYSGIRIGPVVKKDVMKASIMLEHDNQFAVILAFDVKIERDAQDLADSLGVKIFSADIIYHLFDKFTAYREELRQKKRDQFKHVAVFPCRLRILPQFIFNTRDPIVVGVSVEAGVVREGTPLCVPTKEFLEIGIVSTIEVNHKPMESARKGQEVCIKIENVSGETPKLYGRHFDYNDQLVSKISRQSIDACKEYFRDDLQKSDWQLMVELKKLFKIM